MQESSLHQTVNDISKRLGFSEDDIKTRLEISDDSYESIEKKIDNLDLFKIMDFANSLDVDFSSLMRGELDIEVLYRQFNDLPAILPAKYSQYKTSRVRTVQGVTNFLAAVNPMHLKIILKKLQINQSLLIHPEELIDVRLIDDMYKEMAKLGYSDHSFEALARSCANDYRNSFQFFKRFKGISTPQIFFENFFDDHIKYLDQNWDYEVISSNTKGMLVKVTTNKNLQECIKNKQFGSWGFTKHRAGMVKGLYNFTRQGELEVDLKKTIHQGDDYCLYSLDYQPANLH